MSDAATIVLMGLRGSGKSTLGRRLAKAMGRDFVDLDLRTAASMDHATPGEALRSEGLDAFRAAEAEALRSALDEPGIVLALGGGTPTAPGAAELLEDKRRDGAIRTVYLRAEPDTLARRLDLPDAPDRPGLLGDDPVAEVATLFNMRDPAYRGLADGVIHLDGAGEDATLAMLRSWAENGA